MWALGDGEAYIDDMNFTKPKIAVANNFSLWPVVPIISKYCGAYMVMLLMLACRNYIVDQLIKLTCLLQTTEQGAAT